jgi:glycerol-3-phosphate dehydrogenase
MAEDCVNQAATLARLPERPCVTEHLKIHIPEPLATSGEAQQLHPALLYTTADVLRAVRDEMARNLEDVLARRTRALFLNARAAIEIAPRVAALMARELGCTADWEADQVRAFGEVARGYLPAAGSGGTG